MLKRLKLNYYSLVLVVSIVVVLVLSLGRTLNYFFYTDDFAMLYYVQNSQVYTWPYLYVVAFFTPFYKIFGFNPRGYFSLALLIHFLASIGVYFFVKLLTKKRIIAFLSTLVFATGYIALDQFTQTAVVSINNINNLLILTTLIFLLLWVDRRKIKLYFLTLFFFWASTVFAPFRAFALILYLPIIEVILSPGRVISNFPKSLLAFFIRYAPFLLISYWYVILPGSGSAADERLFKFFSPDLQEQSFSVLGRILVSEEWVKLLGLNPATFSWPRAGLILFFLILILALLSSFGKRQRQGRALLISVFLTIFGYIGYLVILSTELLSLSGHTNRYLIVTSIGYSFLIPTAAYLIVDNLKFLRKDTIKNLIVVILTLPFVITMIFSARKYEENIINRSLVAKRFYSQLKDYVPTISGKNYFYFDRTDNHPTDALFDTFLQGALMPKDAAIATFYEASIDLEHYQFSEDITIVLDSFEELLDVIKSGEATEENLHTFYFDESGLHSTKRDLFVLLGAENKGYKIPKENFSAKKEATTTRLTTSSLQVSSLTPTILDFDLRVSRLKSSSFALPFSDPQANVEVDWSSVDKSLILDYLLSRERYYDGVRVKASLSDKRFPQDLMVDSKLDTTWAFDESWWLTGGRPVIEIDLGEQRKIGKLVWESVISKRIPIQYKIQTSVDGVIWREVEINRSQVTLSGLLFAVEEFEPHVARFIRIDIEDTQAGWTPWFSEIEVVEEAYVDIDLYLAHLIKDNPFLYIKDEADLFKSYEYLKQTIELTVLSKTNKDINIQNNYKVEIPVFLDGVYHTYQIIIPPRGTELEELSLELTSSAFFEISNVQIIKSSLESL